ncbi:3'-5' exonuclease [Geoalkalibacter halelectricus]|uniref:3'-5' exonuclease n=1 Tax=Geoalkalibacter halelectricus TaxID=2847045 RepID=UPI003D1E39D7
MNRVVVFDVETTGLSAQRGARVIEIGALALEEGQIVAEFHRLIDCGVPISAGARRVHGITAAMLRGHPDPSQVWPAFHAFIANTPLVAHNAPFDLSFLHAEFARLDQFAANPVHCTLKLSRRLLPHLPNHQLATVHRHLCGAPGADMVCHRALGDARMTAQVWLALQKLRRKA